MIFRNHTPAGNHHHSSGTHGSRRSRRHSGDSDSSFDSSDGEDIPESVVGPIEIPKSPSLPVSARQGSTPGMRAPSHINFNGNLPVNNSDNPINRRRSSYSKNSLAGSRGRKSREPRWPQQLYKQWFGAITEGRSIQVHAMLADYPEVLNMRRIEPTPFHSALTPIASDWLGMDTTGMDGLQVAIMGYKNAYAHWRIGNQQQQQQHEHMSGMTPEQMREHVAVREVILSALIDATSPEQLDSHLFGRQHNTTLHLAAFYNDANLVERLLRQGAAVDIRNKMGFLPASITNDKPTLQWLAMYREQVRGTRYQMYPPHQPAQVQEYEFPQGSLMDPGDPEVPMEMLEHFSDEEDVPAARDTGDLDLAGAGGLPGLQDSSNDDTCISGNNSDEHIKQMKRQSAQSNEYADDQDDEVSLLSSSGDRTSLGLGGSRTSMEKRNSDHQPMQKRIFDKKRNSAYGGSGRPVSMVSIESSDSGRPRSSSNADSMLSSYYSAGGLGSESEYQSAQSQTGEEPVASVAEETDGSDTVSQVSDGGDPLPQSNDRSIRIKVDPSTINDDDIEGIFSDSDEVVQQEPSYCQSGSGLSDSSKSVSPALSATSGKHLSLSSLSSSGSINMQSLAMAVEKAHMPDLKANPVSAFPVSMQSAGAPAPEMAKKLAPISTSPTHLAKGDDSMQRPTSPFSLRDSLYEMIMGRPASTASMASRTSTNSNSESSSSTVGVSSSASPFGVPAANETPESGSNSLAQTAEFTFRPRAMTQPDLHTSMNDWHNGMPEPSLAVGEESSAFHDEPEEIDVELRSRTPSPVPAPRPTAASLFAIAEEPEADQTVSDDSEDEEAPEITEPIATVPEPVKEHEQAEKAASETPEEHEMPLPSEIMTKNGRIGRRGGRITAEMMADDPVGFSSEPVFTLASSKLSSGSLAESAAAKTDYEEPQHEESTQEEPMPPPDLPLTRDKREEYLQTLIKRNSSKPGAPNKAIPRFGASSPIGRRPVSRPLSSLRMYENVAEESGDDGDEEDNSAIKSPLRKKLIDERPGSRLDSRSPSVLGNRSTAPVMAEKRPREMTREAHSVSGASINGRIRAQTFNAPGSAAPALQPRPSVRKISPSLANLKTRNLVSQSTARKTEQPANALSPVGVPLRSRAMSTPVDARPPSSLKVMTSPSNRTINLASMNASGPNSARIGRVAALSQNFERQTSVPAGIPSRPTSFIEDRTSANSGSLGLVSAPAIPKRPDLRSPVERSTSISSTFSRASGHESSSGAGGSGVFHDSGERSNGSARDQPDRRGSGDGSGDAPVGGGSGTGNGGNDGGDDGSSSPSQSVNTLERQDSTTSNSTTSSSSHSTDSLGNRSALGGYQGLGSPLEDIAEDLELDHSAYEDYNIFTGSDTAGTPVPETPVPGASPLSEHHASVSARKSSDSAPASVYHKPGFATSSTNSPSNSHKGSAPSSVRRDSQHGSRRKSGTLARISGSGVVRQRQALFNSAPQLVAGSNCSDSPVSRTEVGSPPGSGQHRFRSGSVQMSEGNLESAAFFRRAGEGSSSPVVGRPHPAAMVTGSAATTDSSDSLDHTTQMHGGDPSSSGSNPGSARQSSDVHSEGSPRVSERRSPLPRIDVVDETRSRLSSNGSKHSNESGESIFTDNASDPNDSVQAGAINNHVGLAAQLASSPEKFSRQYHQELSVYRSRSSEELTPGLRSETDATVPFYPDPHPEGVDEGMQGYYPDPRAPSDEYIAIEDLDKIDDDEIADIEMRRQGIFDEMMPATGSGHKPFNLSTVFEEDEERSSLRTSRASLRGSREWQPGTIAGTHTPSPMGLGTSNGSSLASSAGKASTESPRQSLLSTASDPVQTKRPEMQQRPRPLSQPQSVVRRMSAISEAYDKDIDEEEEEAEDNEPLQTLASPARSAKVSPHGSSASTGNLESPVKVSPRDSAASMGVRSNFVVPGAEDDKGSVRSMANSSGSFPFDAQAVYGPSLEDTSTMASRSSMGRPEIGVMSRPVSASASLMMLQPMDSGDLAQSSGVRSRHSPTPYDSNAQLLEQAAQRANQPLAGHVTVPDHSIIGHSIGMTTDTEEGGHQDDYVGNTSVSTAPIELVFPKASTPPAPTVELGHGFASVESLPEGTHPLQLVPNDVLFRVPLSDHARTALNELNDPRLVAQWEQQQLALLRQQHSRSTHDRQEEMKRVSQFKRGPSNSLESEQGGLVYDHELALTDAPTQGITSRGTIRQLHKRPRNSDAYYPVFDLIPTSRNRPAPDAEEQLHPDDVSLGGSVRSSEASVSSHERQVGVVDEAFYSPTSQAFPEQTIAANVGEATDEVAEDSSSEVMIGPSGQPIRRNLVLRLRSKSLVDSVMDELATKERHISAPLPALETPHFDDPVVKYEGAGTDHYGTVRPTVIPSFVSQLDGVPAGPFFKPPRASERQGYLYMRILSIEDLEDKTDSVYFVIRNGIDTLATTPIKVGGAASANINQEFRILTDPNVSVTMWMRFRSDAIISNPRNTPMGARARARDPSCLPPMFKKLVRRNTRSRNNNRRWNCARPDDSDFDFSNPSFQYMPGARRPGYAANIQAGQQQPRRSQATVPDRVSSAFLSGQGGNGHYSTKSSTNGNYASDPRSLNATQAPSSVFYDPGEAELDQWSSNKGLVQAKFKEETRGVAVVHVGEMLEEVFLNSLVDSWDVENVWESRKGARLQLQLFFIPACPLFNEDELPRTLGQCENAMEVCNFHNSTLNSGFLSQRGGDTRFWRRRYFRLIGGFLFAYHEDTREPRCFIDINEATRVIDHKEERSRRLSRPTKGVARGFNLPRGSTHRRSNSDFLARGNTSRPFMPASVHEYASDSEPGDSVDIADPALRQSSMRRLRNRDRGASDVSRATFDSGLSKPSSMDSGVVSGDSVDAESGIQHSFSIEFGNQGSIEFYAESEREKLAWVSVLSRMVGCIPKIPSWLIKLLHSDIAEKVEHGTVSSDSSMESMAYGYQPFQPVPGPTMRHSAAY